MAYALAVRLLGGFAMVGMAVVSIHESSSYRKLLPTVTMDVGVSRIACALVIVIVVCLSRGDSSDLKFTSSPEYITLSINSESVQSNVYLRRNTLLDDQPSLYRLQDDGLIKEDTLDNTKSCLYVSESDDVTSLSLTQHAYHDVQLWFVDGFLEVNGTEYLLMPSDKMHTSLLDHAGTRTGVYHLVQTKGESVEKARLQLNVSIGHHQTIHRMRRAAKKVYQIELGIFAAFDIYDAWVKKANQMTLSQAYPSRNIRHFYYHVAIMIDKIFQTIQDPGFEVRVKLNKLYYAPTRESSPWTETSRRGNSINIAMVLIKFSEDTRLKRSAGNFGYDFDTIVLFTGYSVTGSKTGASYMSQMCKQTSASVVSAGLDFSESALRAAHELGHSVGMFHDGDKNHCRSNSCYNMATQISSGQCKSNLWRFSSCSADYFRTYISRIGPRNCLEKNSLRNYANQWRTVRNKIYGQDYGPHEQCKLVEHPDSYLCQNVMKDINNICTEMLCYVPRLNQCRYVKPAAGTPCGNKMMCSAGRCVYDLRAKTVDMSCPYGDHRYEIFIGWTCQGLEDAGYLRNYNMCNTYPGVRERCCETCKKYPRVFY